ncbi:MAG: ComF family protein [Anaerolineae bacterium]|nr:ComF family protein [Anaerolineae bacterium]
MDLNVPKLEAAFITYKRQLSRWILDLLMPPSCVQCGKVEIWLCDGCEQKIPLLTKPICAQCGQPLEDEPCKSCRTTPLRVAPIRSAFLFEDAIHAIHALKYRGATEVVEPLARRMAEAWQFHQFQSDLLVPVPLHPSRELRRGYNQSALLADALGKQIGIPTVLQTLLRVRNTESQTNLNRNKRRENVTAAFACTQNADFSGKVVTLVDDVATTGATLDACATVLMAHGAKTVNAFTLARA